MGNMKRPNPEEAHLSLTSAIEMTDAGLKRGLYPRWFAVATALWAGMIEALIAFESPAWFLLLTGGLIAFFFYRREKGAWVNEVHNQRDLVYVIAGSIILCAIAAGGIVFWRQFGLLWSPIIAGAAIAVGLFAMMEVTHGPAWAQIKRESKS